MNVLRNLGPVEAVRCVASYVWVRVHPPKNQDNLEGFIRGALRVAAVPALLQGVHREGVGRSAVGALGRLGRAARQGPLARAARSGRRSSRSGCALSATSPKVVTSLIEEFKYPKFGPGMMWEVAAEKVTAAGATLEFDRRVTRIGHDGAVRYEVVAVDADGRRARLPVHARDLVDAARRAVPARCSPPVDTADRGGRGRAALPRPPHRRARRARRSTRSPTTGSTSTTPTSRSGGCRTTARGRRSW